ncbi:MAG: FtsK/SpoIIIE domain-containing protein [Veillonellales bacterium]
MLVEIGIVSGISYTAYMIYHKDYLKYKKTFDEAIERMPFLKNNKDEKINLTTYKTKDYGYKIRFTLPVGVTTEKLTENILAIKEAFELSSIHIINDNRFITMHGIKLYNFKQYEPVKLPPNKILIAEFIGNNIIVDMNKFPHALICGDTGTGKSRILFIILTNLIYNSRKVDLYLLQVRKNDLAIFKSCSQVKSCSRTLEEVLEALQVIDKELMRREELLDIEKGYLNIEEYNLKSGQYLKYTYVVIEEFSFLNISRVDSKSEKAMKAECLKIIKSIVNVGRSSGVFLLTSLQKPTSDSIPTDIKAQLTTRIALNIKDKPTCSVVMGDYSAVGLADREIVCKTRDIEKGYSLTIDFPEIKEYTKKSIIEKPVKKEASTKVKNSAIDIMKALGI